MVTITQLAAVPYLDTAAIGDRFIATLVFHDGDWRLWLEAGERGELLIETKGVPAEACYFACEPEAPSDLYLPFLDFLVQRVAYRSLGRAYRGLLDDIFNLSGSFAKLALLEQSREAVPHGLSRMVTGEVEYIVTVVRSLFDLYQEVLMKLWDSIALFDPSVRRQRLKSSFADMLAFKGQPCSAAAISERFGLPVEIASCYERARAIFDGIKRLRDNLIHHGSQLPHIYGGEGSFLISVGDNPFPDLAVWTEDEYRPNALVPLLPVLQTLVHRCFLVGDDFAGTSLSLIQFPPPIVPGMRFFARGYFTDHLVAARISGARRSG